MGNCGGSPADRVDEMAEAAGGQNFGISVSATFDSAPGICLRSDGSLLVSTHQNGKAKICDKNGNKLVKAIDCTGGAPGMVIAKNGALLIATYDGKTARVIEFDAGVAEPGGEDWQKGDTGIPAGSDGTVILDDIKCSGGPPHIAVRTDGTLMMATHTGKSGGNVGTILSFEVSSRAGDRFEPPTVFMRDIETRGGPPGFAVRPDGRLLVSTQQNGEGTVYEYKQGAGVEFSVSFNEGDPIISGLVAHDGAPSIACFPDDTVVLASACAGEGNVYTFSGVGNA